MTLSKNRLYHLLITIGIIGIGAFGMNRLVASKPEMKKQRPAIPAPMVRTVEVKTGPQAVRVRGEGTVRPLREIELVPQVNGKVVRVSDALVDGGAFRRGETLVEIEPADFQLAVTSAEAQLKDAESQLELTEEEASAARQEWRIHAKDSLRADGDPPPLVAKEPQLAAARARLAAARADLDRALLNLERTLLKAPFEGRVAQKAVDIGQYVVAGKSVAVLYSTEAAEITVPLEDSSAFWFHIPGFTPGTREGSAAVVKARIAGHDRSWPGKVLRTEGRLDERTRMINVVVGVEDPFKQKPPLVPGLFVSVAIEGDVVENGVLIPRSAVRDENVVWVVGEDDRLRFRSVEVARVDGDEALIQKGLADNDRVVTTPLKAVTDGMIVRVVQTEEEQTT